MGTVLKVIKNQPPLSMETRRSKQMLVKKSMETRRSKKTLVKMSQQRSQPPLEIFSSHGGLAGHGWTMTKPQCGIGSIPDKISNMKLYIHKNRDKVNLLCILFRHLYLYYYASWSEKKNNLNSYLHSNFDKKISKNVTKFKIKKEVDFTPKSTRIYHFVST